MKTAIEWLEQHLKELENKVFNFEVSPFESPVIREDLYKQAKAMEKEQICNAYTDGLEGPYLGAEEYHNRTYSQKGIDAGIFLADLLTKELEELGDEDLDAEYKKYVEHWGDPIDPINYKLYSMETDMPCFHPDNRLFTKEEFRDLSESNELFRKMWKLN
jgi:hypothetical protein